ncbi:ATP-binding protein [Schaalia sp. Marseille-Q2122]|uniref:ATP-binding protein n=1 Tax=Schaalia sp. Marseille-Q2122 TaxID=2736604 RepID=UPI001588C6A1|nr:ATP-binding protein [Schaalia sp. Marseille-Q2122]
MNWDINAINALLAELRRHGGDSTTVEVKRSRDALPKSIGATICAFANMPDGGTIILGIDEGTNFSVTGVSNPAELAGGLVSVARNAISPAPHIRTHLLSIDDKDIVIADIIGLDTTDRPARYQGRAYLRQADGDYILHEHELRMIEASKRSLDDPQQHDLRIVRSVDTQELVPELVEQYVEGVRRRDRRLSDRSSTEILTRTHIIAQEHPTLAGLYALGDYPQEAFQSLYVTAAVQLPTDTGERRTHALETFTGPLPFLLEHIMDWCATNIPSIRRYRPDGHMQEVPEIPLQAVREIVANALVHRDLSSNTLDTGKSIQIRLTPDRLMVQSPGGLRGISLGELESVTHSQAAVNRHLYSIAQKLRTRDGAAIIEGEGGGIREVIRACEQASLPRPHFIDTGVKFTVLLWRPSHSSKGNEDRGTHASRGLHSDAPSSKNEYLVVEALTGTDGISFAELQQRVPLNKGQLRYALSRALHAGRIIMVGGQGDRDTHYHLP